MQRYAVHSCSHILYFFVVFVQASSLDLAVPPSVLALVDELEAGFKLAKNWQSCKQLQVARGSFAHHLLSPLQRQERASTKPSPAHQLFAVRRAKRAMPMCPKSLLQAKHASRVLSAHCNSEQGYLKTNEDYISRCISSYFMLFLYTQEQTASKSNRKGCSPSLLPCPIVAIRFRSFS